jgi:hypothetical protein
VLEAHWLEAYDSSDSLEFYDGYSKKQQCLSSHKG